MISLVFGCFLFLLGEVDIQPEASTGYAAREAACGKQMMVASASSIASQIGFSILERGGNAIDAATAIQIALTLVEPQSSGIGGGGFLLYYAKEKERVYAYDGRETAPKSFERAQVPNIIGGRSVGTPGTLKMLEMAHSEWGDLPWQELFEPTIELAERGFPLTSRLSRLIEQTPELSTFPATRAYLFENGRAKGEGSNLKNPALAETLRLIADEGTRPFYAGEIARDIVEVVRNAAIEPGTLSMDDLAGYQAIKREPIESRYHGCRVFGFPPPSSGGVAIAQILGMLEKTDLEEFKWGSAPFIELFAKASRVAYASRQLYIGDPDFVKVPMNHILSPVYIDNLLESHLRTPIASLEYPSTSQISVVDREGNAVSFTTSIENAFGSSLMVRGFFLNNQLTDFSTGPNRIEPGKRPMSSMSPTLVFGPEGLLLNVGSAGGARIIDYVAKVLLGVLDFGLDIQEAISFPNFASISAVIDLEKDTFLEKEASALEERGNKVHIRDLTSGTQGIQVTSEGLVGGVDPRRDGLAIGD